MFMTSPMTTDTKSGLDVKFSGGGYHTCVSLQMSMSIRFNMHIQSKLFWSVFILQKNLTVYNSCVGVNYGMPFYTK